MAISAHIARLRAAVGHDLLLLPSVSVLPVDPAGRLLLVRHAGHHDGWAVLGGAVEPGESPAETAVRETREEIGVDVRLVRLLDVLGGPDYEVTYPNGDRTAYVTSVYEAAIVHGAPAADHEELSDLAWFTPAQLANLELSRFARALLSATGYLGVQVSLPVTDTRRKSAAVGSHREAGAADGHVGDREVQCYPGACCSPVQGSRYRRWLVRANAGRPPAVA